MRLIDADAVIKELEKDLADDRYNAFEKAIGRALIRLLSSEKLLPTIKAEPVRHGLWIPFSQKLPENHQEVLCYSHDEYGDEIFVDVYISPEDCDYWLPSSLKKGLREGTVTHWMPLPEPPESEVQNE